MKFTVDQGIFNAYRSRSAAAHAAIRDVSEALRHAKLDRNVIIERGKELVRNRAVNTDDPVEALHPEDRKRLNGLEADIQRLQRDYEELSRNSSYASSIVSRATDFAKEAIR